MNTYRISRGYDVLARHYETLSRMVYGNALRRAQTCHLAALPPNAVVLVVGGGSGWFLEQLLLHARPAHVIYLDLSPKMVELARRRIERNCPEWLPKVEFLTGNVGDLTQSGGIDVVVTHFLLDMFDGLQLRSIMGKLKGSLATNGLWCMADFRHVPSGPMRWISGFLIWLMYRFFRWFCEIPARSLPDFEAQFLGIGMAIVDQKRHFGGMVTAEVWKQKLP